MNRMLTCVVSLVACTLLCVAPGCETSGSSSTADATDDSVALGSLQLCNSCGHFQGAPECCDRRAPKCDDCGLAKGTPGCCRIAKDSDRIYAVCDSCGHIKGSQRCCKKGQERCSECNLVKGSAGCCRIPS
ncbi:MAG: hypothetical protein ACYTGP_12340 [Planctomycetota bacterium]|jgi:hypothetical protein